CITRHMKGGHVNPFVRQTEALRQDMLDAVTPDYLQAIVQKLIQKAREGDVSAARLVLAYAVGKPDRAVDPDTLDVQEWQQLQQSAVPSPDLLGVLGRLQAPLACTILRAALPHLQEAAAQSMAQQLKQPDPVPEAKQESKPSYEPDGCHNAKENGQAGSRSKPNSAPRPVREGEPPGEPARQEPRPPGASSSRPAQKPQEP